MPYYAPFHVTVEYQLPGLGYLIIGTEHVGNLKQAEENTFNSQYIGSLHNHYAQLEISFPVISTYFSLGKCQIKTI